ncbi:glycosyl hydrolase family 76-domain-containing protein [Aspergillus fruticulosus]
MFLSPLQALTSCRQQPIVSPDRIRIATTVSGNETGRIPGAFPEKWREGSVLFMSLIYYWYYTGNDQYNALGNDDQLFCGATEVGFPEDGEGSSWLSLAQGFFNSQTNGWDNGTCGEDAISNGGFFQLAARLARYTNNDTYFEWAQKAWDWFTSSPLARNKTWNWSYNYGTYLTGAAYMYNYTGKAEWKGAVDGLLAKLFDQFFPKRYLEVRCVFSENLGEPSALFNFNEILFQGYCFRLACFSLLCAAFACSEAGNNSCGSMGMKQQIIATDILSSALASERRTRPLPPLLITTGGVGAGILTVLFIVIWSGMTAWVLLGGDEPSVVSHR